MNEDSLVAVVDDSEFASHYRRGVDRRRRPYLLSDWRYAFVGRRRGARRASDRETLHVDWYPPSLLFFAMGLFTLSALDATLTLHLMRLGLVEEANPLMAPLIAHDLRLFVGVKVCMTAVCVVMLVVYARLRLFRSVPTARIGWYLCGGYALLVAYELALVRFFT